MGVPRVAVRRFWRLSSTRGRLGARSRVDLNFRAKWWPQPRRRCAVPAAGALPMGEAGRQGAGACRAAAQALRSQSRRPPAAVEARVCRLAAGMPEEALSMASAGSAMAGIASASECLWLGG